MVENPRPVVPLVNAAKKKVAAMMASSAGVWVIKSVSAIVLLGSLQTKSEGTV